ARDTLILSVDPAHFRYLPADWKDGIQMGQRILEDHGYAAPVDPRAFDRRQTQDAPATETDVPAPNTAGRAFDQTEDCVSRYALAGSALADDRDALVLSYRKGKIGDGRETSLRCRRV